MDCKYPHWYQADKMEPCYDYPDKEVCECNNNNNKVHSFPDSSFKDRLLCLLGDEVLFSVDARLCGRESFCGTLCYVGCDFIIVNVCMHRRSVSMHVPICMIRFIAPFKS